MKKTRHVCLILCSLLVLQLLSVHTFAVETSTDISVTQGCHTIDAMVPILGTTRMFENATSVLAFEFGTDTLMYSWNADEQIYPASLVKIMTALLTVENAELLDVVTVKPEVLATIPEGAVNAKLQANEVLSVQDLLYCMLIASANDAAAVLADHVSGTQENFVQMMNNRAAEIGCQNTLFTDPHGLNGQQYSTARDIGRILSEAMRNESFKTVFCASEYAVPATNKSEERNLESGNSLLDPDSALYYDPRVIGGRTGTGLEGEKCLASVALSGDLKVISVVIGAKDTYKDDGYTISLVGGYQETKTLLDACLSEFIPAQVIYEGQALKQYKVEAGNADLIVGPRVSVSTILQSNTELSGLTFRYNDTTNGFNAPIENGQVVSNVEIWNGTICIAQADLYAMNSVAVKQVLDVEDTQTDSRGIFGKIVIVLAAVIGTAILLLLGVRLYNMALMRKSQNRAKRGRRDRRRSF